MRMSPEICLIFPLSKTVDSEAGIVVSKGLANPEEQIFKAFLYGS